MMYAYRGPKKKGATKPAHTNTASAASPFSTSASVLDNDVTASIGITFAGIAQGFEKWKQPDNIFEKLSLSGIGPAFSVPASQPAQSPVALAV
mmetsp:Transcript_79927/g.117093  ORF Transcript_79927/g.117093 Transcript_79927/m.117093 type:complete len:93 (+) Transcript_79927:551-829(+)